MSPNPSASPTVPSSRRPQESFYSFRPEIVDESRLDVTIIGMGPPTNPSARRRTKLDENDLRNRSPVRNQHGCIRISLQPTVFDAKSAGL
jgi:hypothetical protein